MVKAISECSNKKNVPNFFSNTFLDSSEIQFYELFLLLHNYNDSHACHYMVCIFLIIFNSYLRVHIVKAILECLNVKNVPNFICNTFLDSSYVLVLWTISLVTQLQWLTKLWHEMYIPNHFYLLFEIVYGNSYIGLSQWDKCTKLPL